MKLVSDDLSASLMLRWYRVGALLLFSGASVVGGAFLVRSFSEPMSFGLLVWVLGMAAYAFGVVFPLLAGLSLVNSDQDQVDLRSTLGVLVLTFGSIFAIGWFGLSAVGMLLAGWIMARLGRRGEDRAWRRRNAERLAFYGRVRRADPRSDPEAARFLPDPPPEDALDRPSSRREAIDQARSIDGDPWQ